MIPELGKGLDFWIGGAAEEGVVDCDDPASDGAFEAIGVAGQEGSGAGTGLSGGLGISILDDGSVTWVSPNVGESSREGNSKGELEG